VQGAHWQERIIVGGRHEGRHSVSTDPFDVELEDPELLDEVGMTASLMVAANQSDGPLSRDEIDRLLGLL
jgi:hypothetical protein